MVGKDKTWVNLLTFSSLAILQNACYLILPYIITLLKELLYMASIN